jgi:hypothetical protein
MAQGDPPETSSPGRFRRDSIEAGCDSPRGTLDRGDSVRKSSKALSVVVLGLAMAAGACTSSHTTARSTTTTTTTTTSSVPRVTPPAGAAVPSGFEPGSVTFVSATTGFVIGIDSSCPASTCVALARTTDGGTSWTAVRAPGAGYVSHGVEPSSTVPAVSEVRFADARDGWIYGPSLFATHDGGATWQRVNLSGSVISLETSGGYVDAVVSPCSGEGQCTESPKLYQATASGGGFVPILTGPSVNSSVSQELLSLHAPVGFADMSGPDASPAAVYATEDLAKPNGWKAFPDPCALVRGDFLVQFVAPDASSLYSLCSGTGAAGSEMKSVVRTTGGNSRVVGTPPPAGDTQAMSVSPSSDILVVAAASGASWLYRSTDRGSTWNTAEAYNDGGVGFNDLGFTTSTQGVVIHGYPGPPAHYVSQLLMTTTSGATWSVVPIT